MKKILATIFIILFVFVGLAFSADVTKTLTFAWDQTDTTNLKEWRLFWSNTAGGPYDTQEVAIIPFDPNVSGPSYNSPTSATVSGDQGTTVTKYFVLVACGDIPQEDGSTKYECSENSNEVSYGFWIPPGKFSVPVNFTVTANP